MITLLSASSAEEITLAVQEFIAQFLPQFLPTFEKYSIIFTGVVAGVGLLAAIIMSVVKLKASKNKLKAVVTPYQMKDEIVGTMRTDVLDKLQGTFDVDITDKLNPLIAGVVDSTNEAIAVMNKKIDAILQAQTAITKVMANVGSLTQEEYSELKGIVDTMPQLSEKPVTTTPVTFKLSEGQKETKDHNKIVV